jgi:hypothetical protein
MGAARIAGVAVSLSAIILLAGSMFGVFPLTDVVLIIFVPCLLILGCLIAMKQRWAMMPARVALWVLLVISALMIVPDPEEAIHVGDPGLQWRFAVFGGYLLVCIVLVGRVRPPKSEATG